MSISQQLLFYEFHSGGAIKCGYLALAFHVGQFEPGTSLGASPQDHSSGLELRLLSQYTRCRRGALHALCRAILEEYRLCAGAARRQRLCPICYQSREAIHTYPLRQATKVVRHDVTDASISEETVSHS